MSDPLKSFYQDVHTRDSVKEFIVLSLKEKAVELTFGGKETQHIKLARELIDEVWNKLEQLYAEKKENKRKNPAR